MEYILKTNNIFKCYQKKFNALNGLSMCIPKGSIYGLIGTNGSGKTTVINHLTGVWKQDEGIITIDDQPVYDNEELKKRIATSKHKTVEAVFTDSTGSYQGTK